MNLQKERPLDPRSLPAGWIQGAQTATRGLCDLQDSAPFDADSNGVTRRPGATQSAITNHEAANAFLAALERDGVFHFQSFAEQKRSGTRGRTYIGTAESAMDWLRDRNEQGEAVCVTINKVKGRRRVSENVTRVRAVFVDLDGAPLAPVMQSPLAPSAAVESSPGRFHAYWFVDGLASAEFTAAQRQLAERFGGDVTVSDLPRVMRLPGFLHQKSAPFTSRLLELHPARRWPWPEFAERMGLRHTIAVPQAYEGYRNHTLFRCAQILLRTGTAPEALLEELLRRNGVVCSPPLPRREVQGIAASAIKRQAKRYSRLDHCWFDSPRFRQLSPIAKLILVILVRNSAGHVDGQVTLTRQDAKSHGLSVHLRQKGLAELEAANLVEYTSRGRPACAGRPAQPDRFRIHLPG